MHRRARYLILAMVAALGTGPVLTACGQKGKLYLVKEETPETKPQQKTASAQAQTTAPATDNTQGAGEGLGVMDDVQPVTPDISGM